MTLETRSLPLLSLLSAALLILAVAAMPGSATGKKKPLKVSCEQLYAEIEKTGAQLQAQYNAKGFTIGAPDPEYPDAPPRDGFTSAERCKKQGKRVRQGAGFMNDVRIESDPPFPGETNPAIREYFWTWTQTVTRTKKRKLRSEISLRCEKYAYEGSSSNPQNTQTFPC
jgi:hypothetical protein